MTGTASFNTVLEDRAPSEVPLWRHAEWAERFPWLVQGTTGRGGEGEPWDLGLAGQQSVGDVLDRWRTLRSALEMETAVHSRQVHGIAIAEHAAMARGLLVMEGYDAHITRDAGLLLTVSVADCVPVFVVDGELRIVALLHAGWRGVAGGILEAALDRLVGLGCGLPDLWLHMGPAICGECYEVGPEVHARVHPGRSPPPDPTPVDLRAALAERAAGRGVPAARITASEHCTRCGPGHFFSHRSGSRGRQMGVLGIRSDMR